MAQINLAILKQILNGYLRYAEMLCKRILRIRISTIIILTLCLLAFLHHLVLRRKYNYKHIPRESVNNELYKEISSNLPLKKSKPDCVYDDILRSKETLENWRVPKKFDDFSAAGISNGSFSPGHCNPLFSVAILVTYRDRQSHLDIFVPYMHNFLRKQNIHYKIFIIEQQDNENWNKGLLFNIGARVAMAEKFPCLILHDVDVLPLDAANLYACLQQPRHMSASVDSYRFVLPYPTLVGGALAIRADHYEMVNGFSNRYLNWGGEDDDFSMRLEDNGLKIERLPIDMSRYKRLLHRPAKRNAERRRMLAQAGGGAGGARGDGLRSARCAALRVAQRRLVTHVAVRT